ncbi:MAG: P-loop NTPase, partial [Candidatus Bathyarchaeia archaeon]
LSLLQLMPNMDGVLIVTIPSDVSQEVVRRAVMFVKELNVPIIGVIENMSGFICPNCGTKVDIFKKGGGEKISEELGVTFLGRIPLDPKVCEYSDRGLPFVIEDPESPTTKAFIEISDKVEEFLRKS